MLRFDFRIDNDRFTVPDCSSLNGFFTIRRTSLDHKIFDYTIKQTAVIVSGFGQTDEIVPVVGGVVV